MRLCSLQILVVLYLDINKVYASNIVTYFDLFNFNIHIHKILNLSVDDVDIDVTGNDIWILFLSTGVHPLHDFLNKL